MISITRQTGAFATILFIVTIAATFVRLYLNPYEAELAECITLPRWWEAVLSALMLFVAAIVVNRAAVKVGLFGGFNTMPVSLYGFISCAILLTPNLLTASATALLTAIGVMFIIRSLQFMNDKESLFTGMLLLGSTAILYPPAITLVLIIPISIFVFPLGFRRILIATTGYLLPLLGASYVCWYMGGGILDLPLNLWNALFNGNAGISLQPLPILTLAILAVLLIILLYGILVSIFQRYSLLVPVRKTIQIERWLLIITIGALFLPGSGISMLPLIAVPASVIAAFALDQMRPKWANFYYITLTILIIAHLFFY